MIFGKFPISLSVFKQKVGKYFTERVLNQNKTIVYIFKYLCMHLIYRLLEIFSVGMRFVIHG